ncbi:hypothetical protein ACIQCJ_07955 [Streptomyces sp. NPDC093221]|uniref:hypothetical protein n=1 Tax=Streptomyces sp. NPDC093221 TaxID=3366032 RepID=UPI003801D7C8
MEFSSCVAAINPSCFWNNGAEEFDRLLTRADSRDEPALIIATLGNATGETIRSPMSRYDAGVELPGSRSHHYSIAGRRLPARSDISLVPGLGAAERDPGLRQLNRPAAAP